MKPEKIFEIKGEDWMRGISLHPTLPTGGIFKSASNFNPFNKMGYLQPSNLPVRYGTSPITIQIQYFANVTQSNLPYMYGYAGTTAGGTTALYEIKTTDGVTTDKSAEISTSTSAARGCAVYKGGFVYAKDTTIRGNVIPVASVSDVEILTGCTSAEHKFAIGADLNLYFTNGVNVGKIVTINATTNNSASVFALETGMTIRDIANDGRYLVIIADNRSGTDSLGYYNSVIAYWDYSSGTLTQRYDLYTGGVEGVQIIGGIAHVLTRDGLYVASVATFPKQIASFKGKSNLVNTYPTLSSQVVQHEDILYWADGDTSKVYGYDGQGKKVFFQPHTATAGNVTALNIQGFSATTPSNLWMATSTPALYGTASSATIDETVVLFSDIQFDRPYKFEYAKVVTQENLASGQSVVLAINRKNDTQIVSNAETFSFASHGAKSEYIFTPQISGGNSTEFNEMSSLKITATKAAVQSLQIWATPLDERQQNL